MKKQERIFVIGHKNPDTDSICSAIAYADIKNRTTQSKRYIPKRAGQINEETRYVLNRFGVQPPAYLGNIGTQVKDMDIHKIDGVSPDVSIKDTWGVLMRQDSPLAEKKVICPEDLWDKPLIVSHQRGDDQYLSQWLKKELSRLNVVATYNLVYNASLLVEEGLGYALCFDKIINTKGSRLCFRPFFPKLEATAYIVWKKYQVFSKAEGRFLECLHQLLERSPSVDLR